VSGRVTIAKNERGAWCVYIDGALISDHRLRDGAVNAARAHIAALAVVEGTDG
jgi:hypothetical protein